MDDESEQSEFHFVIAYTEDELRVLGKIIARQYARAQISASWAVLFVTPVGIGLVVLAVFRVGLIAPSVVPPVLLTAYLAFFAGALGFYWVMRWTYQRLNLNQARRGPRNLWISNVGIRYSGDKPIRECNGRR
jgi:hypothetical protein